MLLPAAATPPCSKGLFTLWLPSAVLNTANILRYAVLSCRAAGGMDAEWAERTLIKEEAAAKDRRNFEWMQQLRREGFRKVRVHRQQYRRMYHACHPYFTCDACSMLVTVR
jgi:hypothetical protein